MRAQVLVTTQDCSATAARALLLVAAVLVCPAGVLAQEPSAAARALEPSAATKALQDGERRAAAGDPAGAVGPLREGIRLSLEDHVHADFRRVVSAHLTLAVAALRLGEDSAAREALENAVRLDPAVVLPEGDVPPVVRRELERAKARVARAGTGEVFVSGPAGARVFVDGRSVGVVPARVSGVPVGTHYVRAETDDGRVLGRVIVVTTEPVAIALDEVRPAPAEATKVLQPAVAPGPPWSRVPWWGWAGGAVVVAGVATVVAVSLASGPSAPQGTVVATW